MFHLAAAIMGVLIRVSPADRYYAAGSSAVGRSTAPVKRQKGWAGRAWLQRRVEGECGVVGLNVSLLTVSVKYSDPFLGRYRAILFDTAAGSRCR